MQKVENSFSRTKEIHSAIEESPVAKKGAQLIKLNLSPQDVSNLSNNDVKVTDFKDNTYQPFALKKRNSKKPMWKETDT